ncbi:ribosome biogenesis GTPase Der [Prosthecobacter sp.]|uniref:ribosome biogenesis GTPase Der n=1 Tax=Prosthecobacter sp. TaxID=1965333 RepID=UPI002488DF82|nr:ribosome biogenesis GTPase Der [Prosthecobacter sp.]MDI1311510.1 ribosome biogenesis GTPase Der [Prosthecobacter sp.]
MLKTVAIVGRPNVGKSALFNRLAGKTISIVHDQAGVTRDRITAQCRRGPAWFEIMDTGGIGASTEDVLTDQVQIEASIALDVADLLMFVVDVVDGITTIDQTLARELRRTNKPVILVCNKADSPKRKLNASEFSKFGFPDTVEVSAAHGLGIDDLVALVSERLDLKESNETEDAISHQNTRPLKLAIVGRPNAGKSSLVNAILGMERAIVSDVPGTTRDALDIQASYNGKHYQLIDTAGIRRRANLDTVVEISSVDRSLQSIKRADLCLLVIDCAAGAKMQDRKIAQFILEERKPCILVMNKWDLFHPDGNQKDRIEHLDELMRREFFFLNYAPLVAISAKNKDHIGKLFVQIEKVRSGSQNRIGTGALNRLLSTAIENTPGALGRSTHSFKLLYATQVNEAEGFAIPVPHFVLFANRASKLTDSYMRYLEKVIRDEWSAPGVPFKMSVRGKGPKNAKK